MLRKRPDVPAVRRERAARDAPAQAAEPLSPAEARALIRAASPALEPADIDLAQGVIRIRHGKGGKTRTVDSDPSSCAIIQRWLDLRRRRGMRSPALLTGAALHAGRTAAAASLRPRDAVPLRDAGGNRQARASARAAPHPRR